MEMVSGPLGWVVLAVVALAVILGVLHFGFHAFGRKKKNGRAKSGVMGDARIEVLETTVVDADRRLVLIRCDRIEHLIMVGGPQDVVVENDVRKVRGPGAPPAKIPGIEADLRHTPATRSPLPQPAAEPVAPAAKPSESPRPAARQTADMRAAPARTPPPVQTPPTHGSNGSRMAPAPAPALRADPVRATPQRPQQIEPRAGQRESAVSRRLPPSPSASARGGEPLRASPSAPAPDRSARASGKNAPRLEPSPLLPAAQVPWSEPDSIENEIVRALRVEPSVRGDQPGTRRETAAEKAALESTATLGDLADRLEEALAREVQSASQPHAEPAADEFGFDSEPATPEVAPPKPAPRRDRPEKRPEPPRAVAPPVAAPEPDAAREPPAPAERREEAPVISLNSRRRESVDQLEDEMARLLGELTSDTKGR